jgi:hypothetical protein
MYLLIIVTVIIVLALCVVGLAIGLLVRKDGQFPETEIGRNRHMRQRGITCVKQDEINRAKKAAGAPATTDCGNCTGCSGSLQ